MHVYISIGVSVMIAIHCVHRCGAHDMYRIFPIINRRDAAIRPTEEGRREWPTQEGGRGGGRGAEGGGGGGGEAREGRR